MPVAPESRIAQPLVSSKVFTSSAGAGDSCGVHSPAGAGGRSPAGAGNSCRARHSANSFAQGVISNITSAESVAVVALFAVGGIRALATQVSLLAASVADGCRTAFPPALPEPLEGAEPDDIPGLGCPFMPFAAGPEGGFRLAAGFLPEPLPVPVPFALLPALP